MYKVANHYREDIYLDKIIKQKFSGSFMNNTKWVKLISALVRNSGEIKECRVKPIWDDGEQCRTLLINEDRKYDFDYYDSAMESMVSGTPTGFYAYKEIEWLDFPLNTSNSRQNIHFIKTLIESLGQFKLELTDERLRLYAYLK